MPHHIKFSQPPAGFSATSSTGDGTIQVVYREFLTSEDGMKLIQRLEGISSQLLSAIPEEAGIKASQIDHLLAHFSKDGEGTIYVNELKMVGEVRLKVGKEKGDPVFENDIVDISRLRFEGIEVPNDHGVIVIFSKGWRKGLYFDLSPIYKGLPSRDYDFWTTLGQCYNYLIFQELHSISDETWEKLFHSEWFPFATLSQTTIKEMLAWVGSEHSVDEVLPKVLIEISEQLPLFRERWAATDVLKAHYSILSTALDRFYAKDWISAGSILYTRIEGILREIAERESVIQFGQSQLSEAPSSFSGLPNTSRLLPSKFKAYLGNVYFRSFDPRNPAGISRNTVGHGVAPIDIFTSKSAALGILIVDQLFYHIPASNRSSVSHMGGTEVQE